MRRIGTLTAAAVVALGVSAWSADSALGARPHVPAARESGVTSLSVVPGKGAAEVMIGVSGPVTVRDFTLHSPDKIVVDITGATLAMAPSNYDEANRGGIVDVRYSQYRKNVVRIVLTLDEARRYNIVRYPNEIRVKVQAEEPVLFVAWRTGNAPVAVAQTGKPAGPASKPAANAASAKPGAAKAADSDAAKPAESLLDKAQQVVSKAADKVANMWAFTEAGLDSTTGATVVPPTAAAPAKTAAPAPAPPRPATTKSAARAADAEPDLAADPLLEVAPPPAPAARRVQRTAAPVAERPAPRRSTQPRITVAWQGAPIRDVIAAFALFSGKTIVVGKGVSAVVDAEIADQPWDVAMSAILAAHGLAAQEDANGIIVVDTYEAIASRVAAEPLTTRTFRLNYTRAASVAQMVTQRLSRDCSRFGGRSPGGTTTSQGDAQAGVPSFTVDLRCPVRGAVTADSLTNSVSVTDVPSNLAQLEQYTRGLDIRQPQVSIRAKIILIDRTQLEGLGLRYDLGTREQYFNTIVARMDSAGRPETANSTILLGGNAISAIANATQRIASSTLGLVYSTAVGKFDFTTFLEALQESSLLDVQSEPSVVTLNNRTANLTAGTQVPVRVLDAGAAGQAGSGLNIPRATVQFRQTGIILNVTPSITANRQVQMRVHAENSDVAFAPGDAGAIFPTQSVDNELLVADGETAVMGGLTQTSVRVSKSGIPLLVDLPIIGRLFGVTNRSETKRDLLILITPHIVDDGDTSSDPARRDR